MSERLKKQLEKMEKQYEGLKKDFISDGNVSPEELLVLQTVQTKLQTLRNKITAAPAEATLQLGGAVLVRQTLGPLAEGPRIGELWALQAADGSGPLNASNSKVGARLNERGRGVLAGFLSLKRTLKEWLELLDEVSRLAKSSAGGLKKMEEAAGAIGEKSKDRAGAYFRGNSEAYIKAQRMVKDAMREVARREQAVTKSLSNLKEAGLGKEVAQQARNVEAAKGAVEEEQKRVEEAKKRLSGLLELAIQVVKQDWVALAEEAAKFVGGEMIEVIPTGRLDQLQKQLEQATAHLLQLEDELLLTRIETASAGLREAAEALNDGRSDVLDALANLKLAQKTAVEVLGESKSTAPAAQMIVLRAKMLMLIERTRQAVERYLRESPPFIVDLDKVAELYRSFPTLVKATPGVDGEYAQTLISTARENVEALATWKSYCVDFQNSARTALRMLSDKGDEGFLAHVNRVPDVLEAAIAAR